MRILYVNHYGKTISGAERVMLNLASALQKNHGVEITALCPDGMLADELRAMGIETKIIEFVKFRRTMNPLFWISAAAVMMRSNKTIPSMAKSKKFDILFSNSYVAHLYACLPARKAGIPAVWHMHDILKPISANRAAVPFASRNANSIITVSGAVKNTLVELGADKNKIHSILNGIDLDAFDAAWEKGPASQFPDKKPGEIHIAIVGQISFIKGQEQFVTAAIELLKSRREKLKFFIIGDIQDKVDAEYRTALEKKVRAAGCSENIIFTGRRNDVPALLGRFDILVHASATSDSCPMVVLEYMYSGKPVIASRIGGVPELITDGENGLLFEPGNTKQLEEKLIKLLDNEYLRKTLGTAGKNAIMKKHTLAVHATCVYDVLKNNLKTSKQQN